jgi:hypothetical protein
MKTAAFQPSFPDSICTVLLADMPAAVIAADPGAGGQTKPLRRAYWSPTIGALAAATGALAIAAAVPTAPPTTPATTSPGQKPLS